MVADDPTKSDATDLAVPANPPAGDEAETGHFVPQRADSDLAPTDGNEVDLTLENATDDVMTTEAEEPITETVSTEVEQAADDGEPGYRRRGPGCGIGPSWRKQTGEPSDRSLPSSRPKAAKHRRSKTGISSRCKSTARIRFARCCCGGSKSRVWKKVLTRLWSQPRTWPSSTRAETKDRSPKALSRLHPGPHGRQRRYVVPGS